MVFKRLDGLSEDEIAGTHAFIAEYDRTGQDSGNAGNQA